MGGGGLGVLAPVKNIEEGAEIPFNPHHPIFFFFFFFFGGVGGLKALFYAIII